MTKGEWTNDVRLLSLTCQNDKANPMALPLAPIAVMAAKYGAVALAGYAVARQIQPGRTDQNVEDAFDELAEGISAHRPRDREQMNGAVRFRRVLRLGAHGPGIEIDASALGRIRLRRL